MEFISRSGNKFNYWFTVGHVIKSRSWIYRRQEYHDIWIRNDDGTEWHSESGLLGLAINPGQRIAFAWCSVDGQPEGMLVAAKNCMTGESRVRSDYIASLFSQRAYGRWLMLGAATGCIVAWQAGLVRYLPAAVQEHPIVTGLSLVIGAGVLGFFASSAHDPDPGREIDTKIQMGLEGMYQAWLAAGDVAQRPRRNRRA